MFELIDKELATSDESDISCASSANLATPSGALHVVGCISVVFSLNLGSEDWPPAERSLSHVEGHVDKHVLDALVVR